MVAEITLDEVSANENGGWERSVLLKTASTSIDVFMKYPKNQKTDFYHNACLPGLYLAVFSLYITTLNPSIPPSGNSGELTITSFLLGVPHPTGYTTYTILSSVFIRFLPFGNIAFRLSIFSALTMALGIAIFYSFLRILNKGKLVIPLLIAFSIAAAGTLWEQAQMPELYAMHVLLMSLALWFGIRLFNNHDLKLYFGFSFFAGIAMTNHLLFVFVFPVILYWVGLKSLGMLLKKSTFLSCVLFFIIGFSITIYLPVRSSLNPVVDWGNTKFALNFIRHLSGSQFHNEMFANPLPLVLYNIKSILNWIWISVPFYFLSVMALGFFMLKREPLISVVLFTCILMVIGLANYNIPDIDNYYVSILLLLGIPALFGTQFVIDKISQLNSKIAFFLSACFLSSRLSL